MQRKRNQGGDAHFIFLFRGVRSLGSLDKLGSLRHEMGRGVVCRRLGRQHRLHSHQKQKEHLE